MLTLTFFYLMDEVILWYDQIYNNIIKTTGSVSGIYNCVQYFPLYFFQF